MPVFLWQCIWRLRRLLCGSRGQVRIQPAGAGISLWPQGWRCTTALRELGFVGCRGGCKASGQSLRGQTPHGGLFSDGENMDISGATPLHLCRLSKTRWHLLSFPLAAAGSGTLLQKMQPEMCLHGMGSGTWGPERVPAGNAWGCHPGVTTGSG